MESKELVVRENSRTGYYVLIAVFFLSLIGSIVYFSKAKNAVEVKNVEDYTYSGEIIYVQDDKSSRSNQPILIDTNEGVNNNKATITTNGNTTKLNENVMLPTVRQLDKNKPMVALTFDDGPNPVMTEKILSVLQKYNARATFFDIGNLMELYPDVVKKELQAGCEVGGHSYTHADFNQLSKDAMQTEVTKLENAFQKITGQSLQLMRPTYGNVNATVRSVVKYPLIAWNVDSRDWESRNTEKILEKIHETQDLNGKVIIMHVLYNATVDALDKLIPELQKQGYQFVTISEMAYYKEVSLQSGQVYYGF